ncbi:Condensin complex subunit 1 [Clonorchis sinensis]|uniref:Condensin complex subunit 1 n=1 Tax=Clonorchis sinensis TaxID=79923 RepID=A0A8T1MI16_CLOSI|nr:Condensin complex subunit 1 [Clonorchis sinensis]
MPDFVIPVSRSDLLKRATPNAYVVNEVFPVRQLHTQLPKCLRILSSEGHLYILRTFDILFSVLHEWTGAPIDLKEEAWELVLKGCEVCVHQLSSLLESEDSGTLTYDRAKLAANRNALRMHVYLLCQYVDMFENDLNQQTKSTAATKIGTKKSRCGGAGRGRRHSPTRPGPGDSELSMDWNIQCEKAVTILDQLCRLQLNKLWDPPVAEEDFINLPANCCYKLLENRSVASSASVRTAMTSLLASLVRRYGHSIACSVKLTQLLQCYPHMVNCLLSFVRSFMEEENLGGVVRELLKEICSYSGADLERDAQTTQNFSAFLLEVASAYPNLGQSMLPLLRSHLDEDPYQMRNCVLGVIGEVLPSFARRENLDPKESVQRDRLMDLLQEHIHDVNGYVRAKALQIWHAIVSTRGLPVRRQSQLAALLVGPSGAMRDVSSLARRYACKTLTAMVLQCPAMKLTPAELQQVLLKETKRLEGLEELLCKVCPYEETEEPEGTAPTDGHEQISNSKRTNEKKHKKHINHPDRTDVVQEGGSEGGLSDNEDGASDAANSSAEENDSGQENLECPPPIDGAESDAAAALEAAIHSAAAIASHTPQDGRSPLRSTSVAHSELSAEVMRQRACVAYLRETSAFSSLIQLAIQDFQLMLASKTLTDVTEAIEFFVTAKHAGVRGLEAGIQQIFIQIWSQDEPIRKAVVEAFQKLYLQVDPEEPLGPKAELTTETADVIVTNLSQFLHTADMGSMVSMERIIQELIHSELFNSSMSSHFWRRFISSAKEDTPSGREDAKSMLLILKMVVKSGPKSFDNHLDTLIQYGLDLAKEPHKVDLERVKFTCDVLQRMVPKPKADKSGNRSKTTSEPFRLPTNHLLFSRLRSILVSTLTQAQQSMWIPMMEQAIGAIYDLAESPDTLTLNLISSAAEKLLRQTTEKAVEVTNSSEDNSAPVSTDVARVGDEEIPNLLQQIKEDPEKFTQPVALVCPSFCLSRFMALAGHACLKQLVHLEFAVLNELKRRAALKEDADAKSKRKSRKNVRQSRLSTASFMNASTVSGPNGTSRSAVPDDPCGLVGVAADDAEADYIRHICDNELLTAPNHFFYPLLNLVTHVCSSPVRYANENVQASASLALAKMMLVNSEVCEPRLQLLFTMAEKSQSEVVRANLIVALGDLCRRFPNLLEPWTPNMYARLRDTSAKVRTNALNTLSHLILNDMVKVKGQISEMTVCLVDEIDRLNVLARQFFTELAQKGTALYNVVPDIISRLSDPDVGVSEDHFHSIVEFLLPLIGRERLCETLVEKICARFRSTRTQRQWRDLAYCLTVISFNERTMRVLYENIIAFADKLCVPEVYSAFDLLITNAKKFTKPDGLARLEEFEAKVKEFHEKGVSDEAAVHRAEMAAKTARRKGRFSSPTGESIRRNLRRVTRTTAPVIRSDAEEEETDKNSQAQQPLQTEGTSSRATRSRAAPRRQKKRRAARAAFSSDEEDEDPDHSDVEED